MGVYLGSNAVNVLGGQPSGGGTPTLQTKSKTYTPTTSQQTESVIADNGYDGLEAVNITVNAMPSGTAGTPTASKGSVSNHSISVTPSVTNTSGYITGSTKTGTAVTVTASELASGNKAITQNGTGIDVVGYSTVSVDVAGVDIPIFTITFDENYEVDSATCNKTYGECYNLRNVEDYAGKVTIIYADEFTESYGLSTAGLGLDGALFFEGGRMETVPTFRVVYYPNGTITAEEYPYTITNLYATSNGMYGGQSILYRDVEVAVPSNLTTKTITTNGTYYAEDDSADGYSSVTVNVSGGGGSSKNVQVVQGTTRTTSSTLTAIGAELTVSKTGTYDVYWSTFRSNTSASYTFGSQLYIDGAAYGTQNTTWSNHVQNNHLTGVSLTANQTIRVYGRNSRGSNYYLYAPTLVIIEA